MSRQRRAPLEFPPHLRPVNPTGGPHGAWSDVDPDVWNDWRWQQSQRLRTHDALVTTVGLSVDEDRAFHRSADLFRVALTPYYASLISATSASCPIRIQSIPQLGELQWSEHEWEDPLGEEAHMAAPGVTHRYPDRVLFYVTHNCPVYCRHCTRKRKVADPSSAAKRQEVAEGIAYIRTNTDVRDVLLSGGDPLTLSDDRLCDILYELASVPHIEVLRIGTRNPVTLPQRFTEALCTRLRSLRPLYVHTHFNHPAECTEAAGAALERLVDAGCVLGNQMVLLKGVNDDPETVLWLNRWLLRHGCRPYYIFQADMAQGIDHLRTPLSTGLSIVAYLRGRIGGMGVPHFAVDLPGGGGKITLTPEYLVRQEGNVMTFRNARGSHFQFVDVAAKHNGGSGSPVTSCRREPHHDIEPLDGHHTHDA